MAGGDLPTSDPRAIDLLTNADVLAVLRHSRGNRQERRAGELVVWTAEATDRPARYLALFAVGDGPLDVRLEPGTGPLRATGPGARAGRAVELWTGQQGALSAGLRTTLPPHGCALYRLEP